MKIVINSFEIGFFVLSAIVDIEQHKITFDASETTFFNYGKTGCQGIFISLKEGDDIDLMEIDMSNPQILPSSNVMTFTQELTSNLTFLFTSYTIVAKIKQANNAIYTMYFPVLRLPVPKKLLADGTIDGDVSDAVNCLAQTITIRDTSNMAYCGKVPKLAFADCRLHFPAGTRDSIPFTQMPIKVDGPLANGTHRVSGILLKRYDFGSGLLVDLKMTISHEFVVSCGSMLTDILCGLQDIYKESLQYGQRGLVAGEKLAKISTPLFIAIIQELTGRQNDEAIDTVKKVLGICRAADILPACPCDCDDQPATVPDTQTAPDVPPPVDVTIVLSFFPMVEGVKILWNGIPPASSYLIGIAESVNAEAGAIIYTENVDTPAFLHRNFLQPATQYFAKVIPISSIGTQLSEYATAYLPFTTAAAMELVVTPAATTLAVSWAAVTDANAYHVDVAISDNGVPGVLNFISDLTGLVANFRGLTAGTSYFVRATAFASSVRISTSLWIPVTMAAASQITMVLTPNSAGASVSVDDAVPEAKHYVFQVFAEVNNAQGTTVIMEGDVTDLQFEVSGLSQNTPYYIVVSAYDIDENYLTGYDSLPVRFTTLLSVIKLYVVSGNHTAEAMWNAFPGATQYQMTWYSSAGGAPGSDIEHGGTTALSYTPSIPLLNSTHYFAKLEAQNGPLKIAESAFVEFVPRVPAQLGWSFSIYNTSIQASASQPVDGAYRYHYDVYFDDNTGHPAGAAVGTGVSTGSTPDITIPGLQPGTDYVVTLYPLDIRGNEIPGHKSTNLPFTTTN